MARTPLAARLALDFGHEWPSLLEQPDGLFPLGRRAGLGPHGVEPERSPGQACMIAPGLGQDGRVQAGGQRYHPSLAAHLRAAIRTGTTCTYQPAQLSSWNL